MVDKTKYGVRIKNFEAKSLYEYNLGINFKYEYCNAMLNNSLLLNFLKQNGLKIENGGTNDLICIKFNQDSRDFESEKEHWEYLIENKHSKKNPNKIYTDEQLEYFEKKLSNTINKQDLFCKKTKDEIREMFYENGVDITYDKYDKHGNVKSSKVVHYKMLYRSTGKAKSGECMFICNRLYDKALNFIRMGIKLPKNNAPIVEMGAYSSLVSSTIIDTLYINPKSIVILKDVDSIFKTNITSIETDDNKHCIALHKENYELKNTMFDGQGLIDESIFPNYANGYVLLRHHMCKMACFKTNIQKFFKDYYGDEYYNATIIDMFGNEHNVSEIKLITTDNAVKWLKFGITYDYWCEKVKENGCQFGVVKTAHESKLGQVQKMSYQMINSLNLDTMDKVVEKSVEYISLLKNNNEVFLDYLLKNKNFSNDYEVLYAICQSNNEFVYSDYFRKRKKAIIDSYTKTFKSGKVIQNGDNLVIVGSPYAMLLYTVGENVENDITFNSENGAIQCFTTRFEDGEYLAEFRNPFNSKANLGYLHNVYHEYMFKYFDFGRQIIAINMLHTDFQDRNNGSDQDSDSIFCTNQPNIVEWAKYCYSNYHTVVNNIPKDSKTYDNTSSNFALIDSRLSKAQESIGNSSNIAQIAQTYTYNFNDQKYRDYVDILAVIAQISIDSAKRSFDIDIESELERISKDMDIKTHLYPIFWKSIQDKKRIKSGTKAFSIKKINKSLKCPMNYLSELKLPKYHSAEKTLPISYFFNSYTLKEDRRKSKKVEELIQRYSLELKDCKDYGDDNLLLRADYEELLEDIKSTYISKDYIGLMSWLIDRAFLITPYCKSHENQMSNNTLDKNKALLLKVLYDINSQNILQIFSKNIKK